MQKTAAILAFLVGAMSVVAGAKAMQGWNPGYQVLNWLPVYNFLMGIFTVAVPAVLIWKNSRYAMGFAIAVFLLHTVVAILLIVSFQSTAAVQSMFAMLFRAAAWLVILALMYFSARQTISPTE
jgi:hypothetical protein